MPKLYKTNTLRFFLHEQLLNQSLVLYISACDFLELIQTQ